MAVNRDVALPPGAMSQGEWEGLQIPVGVAFFFFSSTTQEVHAFYPGPAGATESMLPLDAWDRIRDADPVITTLVPIGASWNKARAKPRGRCTQPCDEG